MVGEDLPGFLEDFSESALAYVGFVASELVETEGAAFFKLHFPAPEDMSADQLERMADELRLLGWRADVAPVIREDGVSLGVRVRSEDQPD